MASATVTATQTDIDEEAPERPDAWFTPGWAVAAVLLIGTAATLSYYGVSAHDIAMFAVYSILGIALPGALIWRGLLGRSGHIAVDLAAGTTLGFAVELPVYVICRALDAPLAVIAWPLLTYAIFAAVPPLRRHWRGSGRRQSIGETVFYAIAWTYIMVYSAWTMYRVEGLSGKAANDPYIDIPFHLALTGELKNHFPAQIPYVTGQPLNYHWYVYAHIASASWITGIDPLVLITRLIALPALAAFGILMIAIAKKFTHRSWPGMVAILLALSATVTSPFGWSVAAPSLSPLDYAWLSPTEAYANAIFAGLILVLVGILHGTYGRRIGPWIVLAMTAGAVAGAKATYLPLLVCGAVFVLIAQMILTRRPGVILWVLGVVAVWLAFAQFVLFGGGTEGMIVSPLVTAKRVVLGTLLLGPETPANPWGKMLAICLLTLLTWAIVWFGALGMATRERRRDTAAWLIFGIGAAGIGAVFAFAHPNLSQYYFVVSSRPYVALAVAIGLAALVDLRGERGTRRRERITLWVAAVVLGAAAIYTVQDTIGRNAPTGAHQLIKVTEPFALLIAILAVLAVGVWVFAIRKGLGRRTAVGAIAIMAIATTAPLLVSHAQIFRTFVTSDDRRNAIAGKQSIPDGGIAAMHWLRDNSSPDDIIATNEHCRAFPASPCDPRDFWVSGYSERRVLVQGWAYTERALMGATPYKNQTGGPYWDPALLAENDAVFTAPTAANVAALAADHGVRWLVVVGTAVNPALASVATLRFQATGVSVYEIN